MNLVDKGLTQIEKQSRFSELSLIDLKKKNEFDNEFQISATNIPFGQLISGFIYHEQQEEDHIEHEDDYVDPVVDDTDEENNLEETSS